MGKKLTAALTVLVFLLFDLACTMVVREPVANPSARPINAKGIFGAILKSGAEVRFTDDQRIAVTENGIAGTGPRVESIAKTAILNVKSFRPADGGPAAIAEIVMKSGDVIKIKDNPEVTSVREESDRYILTRTAAKGSSGFVITFSDIDFLLIRRPNTLMTILVGVPLGYIGLMLILVATGGIHVPFG